MRYFLTSFLIVIFVSLSAQNEFSTKHKKAIKRYKQAQSLYELGKANEAFPLLDDALGFDANFIEAYLLKGQIYYDQNQFDKEAEEYEKVLDINRNYSVQVQYLLSIAYYNSGQYPKAYEMIQEASEIGTRSKRFRNNIDKMLKAISIANELYSHPVPYEPINLGSKVNSPYDDYWPMLTANGSVLYTTKNFPIRDDMPYHKLRNAQEDFFVNYLEEDSTWGVAYNMNRPLNTPKNEGAPSISADGKTFVYTACNRKDGFGRCDLYISRKKGKKWTVPQNIGKPINTPYLERQPSLSPDGKTIYFASNRKGTRGLEDLWLSHFDGEKWSEPVNLGDSINTDGIEWSPFMHPDNKTLYFVSSGHYGMGGLDIFKATKINDTTWSKPVNIGYPINTQADEQSLFVNVSGDVALISSDRAKDGNGLDIYSFELHPKARPDYVSYIEGIISDIKTNKPLRAVIQLIDLESGKLIMEPQSDEITGEYLLCLPPNKDYMLNISKKGYLPYSDHFSLTGKHRHTPLKKDIQLYPIEQGASTVLKNIFFELDSYKLKSQSKIELDKLIAFLNLNANISIEIGGHTDNQGSESYNRKLSEERAKTVYDYLINHQIESSRLSYKGYGLSKPIDSNETPEGRANNRRTEFKIVGL